MRSRQALAAPFAALAALFVASPAGADPQFGTAVTVGGALLRATGPGDPAAAFHLGARADVLFLRERNADLGLGPYLAVGTEAFDTLAFHAGLEWLVPVLPAVPVIVSAGGGVSTGGVRPDAAPMGAARLYFGSRSYNFDAPYSLTFGAFVEARYSVERDPVTTVIAGLTFDASFLLYPLVFLQGAAGH